MPAWTETLLILTHQLPTHAPASTRTPCTTYHASACTRTPCTTHPCICMHTAHLELCTHASACTQHAFNYAPMHLHANYSHLELCTHASACKLFTPWFYGQTSVLGLLTPAWEHAMALLCQCLPFSHIVDTCLICLSSIMHQF